MESLGCNADGASRFLDKKREIENELAAFWQKGNSGPGLTAETMIKKMVIILVHRWQQGQDNR